MKAIEDLKWLAERLPNTTEAQREMFTEKVAITIVEGGMDEDEARK